MTENNPVLVVDDDAALRELITVALEEEGIPVEAVEDGMEALTLVAGVRPSLILLDMNLPVVNGFGVAAGIRARFGEEVPIVLLSGSQYTPELADQLQAYGYLRKPFDLDELLETVQAALSGKRVASHAGAR